MKDRDQAQAARPPRTVGTLAESADSPLLEPLLRAIRAQNGEQDLELIRRAFDVAHHHHAGQKRKSGDPYITHPVAVATILAELGLNGATLAAALLHDTVEDTDYSLDTLTGDFGEEIALLVDGVTKLDKLKFGDAAQAETVRKMVLAMAKDIRVLMIKLADRLHNARTWRYVPPEKSAKKAKETLEIFSPLAHRLGMNTIKWELEDLSFAALYPKVYEEIVRLVGDRTPQREKFLTEVRSIIADDLNESSIGATITGRPKHYYSIYQKMIVRGKEFDDIHDLMGVRVLVESVRDCYAALGALHARWTPLPGRFKDYIAMPKFNMYQSLHTTVLGPAGKPVEVQIRTHEMHRRAEYGVAAHWKYKQDQRAAGATPESTESPTAGQAQGQATQMNQTTADIGWLRSLVDWQSETTDPDEFLESLRYEINTREVFVYTPKGEVISLPAGATPVDFAYAIHTDVGHKTIGARVNGKLVPLSSELNHGDWVEIFTSKAEGAGPSNDWLMFVKSARARNKIRHWFSKERREESIERGKEMLTKAIRKSSLPLQKVMNPDVLLTVSEQLHYTDISGLYAGVGEEHVSTQNVIEHLLDLFNDDEEESEEHDTTPITSPATKPTDYSDAGIIVKGAGNVLAKLARCCTPVPPDEIEGFVTRGQGVSVHRADCRNVKQLRDQPGRLIEVEWAPTKSSVFLVEIQVEALDRKSLLSDVTRTLAESQVNILSATVHTSKDRVAISRFSFEMGDPRYLNHVLNTVRRIDGVYDVYRTVGKRRETH
ncbi:bifunctional (p)ppGpp synthetase/guanosine-3',5'-bis(diphosphate) 3'-pyrophosphohydrolase [Nesterenkonia sp. MY13]|uniref:Bifunctional (P)ppGpp synthetase/guanosine-3',5'-bis(Diphosphate) 3'-pyrophosphohydrolase n=1 Tax=Nesterenkonia sedimenti TaxID=1463632 RepID=A0A7X8THP1_9MICC|nr:bifunctional (p)ppGpp synthetase/guanosine-3',5'-bis(diphosphate) 3'-pyrophosphohydrolase [Nesterenkonia sedimenti]NLS08731.1 bifunctional (p)ppGpp synthetase/guanosine-3',5'-bis(diphosphate) 3'-pyrophosphohydrolase [Nesterenkonia sedimenti]